MNVPFYKPYITGNELVYMKDIIDSGLDLAGDGTYTKKVHAWFESRYGVRKALLTTSGTTALELAVRLLDLRPGDQVIVPSFTFSSSANAVLLSQGVNIVFADIDPGTFNIDPADIERKITPRTKAIMAVHYAGVACDMESILRIATRHGLKIVEDAAQGIESSWNGKQLGTIGDFGCLSFHGTKNVTSGEGGALFINNNDPETIEKAEIIREKGTNRSKFLRGLVDKYTWVDLGGSFLPSDLLAAFLYAQLEQIGTIQSLRSGVYKYYHKKLKPLAGAGKFTVPVIPPYASHNSHIYYIVLSDENERNRVMDYLRANGIAAAFHYVPLHSSPYGTFLGSDPMSLPATADMSARMLRLPLYSGISRLEQDYVIDTLKQSLGIK